jgi:hypothetical protein
MIRIVSFTKISFGNSLSFLFFSIFLFTTLFVQSQELNDNTTKIELVNLILKPYKIISFGESINFGKIDNSIEWNVSNEATNNKISFKGNEINNYKFETPGTYKITSVESKLNPERECNHVSFPEQMIIEVSPYKMEFDFSSIKFSKKIVGGVGTEDCHLIIDANLKSYTNQKIDFTNAKIVSAGIDTTIEGQLLNNVVTLFPGKNNLVYQLKGAAKSGNFIMLDFFDINGQVHSFYYPTKL